MACKHVLLDMLKLVAPVGWLLVAIAAAAMYTVIPILDDRTPRYFPAFLALTSGAMALGCAVDVWVLWRHAAYSAALRSRAEVVQQTARLRCRRNCTAAAAVLLLVLTLVLGFAGPTADLCGHSSCGADVSWTTIALLFVLAWTFVVHMKIRALAQPPVATAAGAAGAGDVEAGAGTRTAASDTGGVSLTDISATA